MSDKEHVNNETLYCYLELSQSAVFLDQAGIQYRGILSGGGSPGYQVGEFKQVVRDKVKRCPTLYSYSVAIQWDLLTYMIIRRVSSASTPATIRGYFASRYPEALLSVARTILVDDGHTPITLEYIRSRCGLGGTVRRNRDPLACPILDKSWIGQPTKTRNEDELFDDIIAVNTAKDNTMSNDNVTGKGVKEERGSLGTGAIFETIPIIRGRPASEYSDEDIVELIHKERAYQGHLEATGVDSIKINSKVNNIKEGIDELVRYMDEREG